jgi:hypothetical protein
MEALKGSFEIIAKKIAQTKKEFFMNSFYTNFFSDEKLDELRNWVYPDAHLFLNRYQKGPVAAPTQVRKRSPRSQQTAKVEEISSKKLSSTEGTSSSRIKKKRTASSKKTNTQKVKKATEKVLSSAFKVGE